MVFELYKEKIVKPLHVCFLPLNFQLLFTLNEVTTSKVKIKGTLLQFEFSLLLQ